MIWPEFHKVVISRTMNPYEICIDVWPAGEDVEISMKLNDFLTAVAKEVGSPARLLTRDQLLTKLQQAATIVTERMKSEIIQVYHR